MATSTARRLAPALLLALAACGHKATLPDSFEVIGETRVDAGTLQVVRDKGTGCEFIVSPTGMIPRGERSADGLTVKQRCVITGEEQPATVVTTNPVPAAAPGATTQAVPPAAGALPPAGSVDDTTDPQERAIRQAVQEMQAQNAPPAAAPPARTAPAIPPPSGRASSRAVTPRGARPRTTATPAADQTPGRDAEPVPGAGPIVR